ncbi:MAG: hypothetical protein FJ098_08890 [Deltaproteobacteria bacterium]|nr:hypothetical protein [Deltaproteobacteria bacterium]
MGVHFEMMRVHFLALLACIAGACAGETPSPRERPKPVRLTGTEAGTPSGPRAVSDAVPEGPPPAEPPPPQPAEARPLAPGPGPAAPPAPEPPLVRPSPIRSLAPPPTGHLLTPKDLEDVLGDRGWSPRGPVPGVPPDDDYSSLLYQSREGEQAVLLQVWQEAGDREALARWNGMLGTWPGAQRTDALVPETFFWTSGTLGGLVFLEADHSRVLGVACDTDVCDDTALLRLALAVHGRAR